MNPSAEKADSIAAAVQLAAFDIDGTLTDGRIIIGDNGELAKAFSVRDGLGLRLLMDAGIQVAIITARESKIVTRRCEELRIDHVLQGVKDKASALTTLADNLNIAIENTAFMGDDLPDLPALRVAGLAACVGDAVTEVKAHCHWVSAVPGGHGAARDFAQYILMARGGWGDAIGRFTGTAETGQ